MRGSYKPGQTVFDSPEDFDTWIRWHHSRPASVDSCRATTTTASASCSSQATSSFFSRRRTRRASSDDENAPPSMAPIGQYLGESQEDAGRQYAGRRDRRFQRETGDDQPQCSRVSGAGARVRDLRFTERFTRICERRYRLPDDGRGIRNVLHDGKWSAAFPLKLDNDYKTDQYACHEGNTAIRNYIETSRFERANKKSVLDAVEAGLSDRIERLSTQPCVTPTQCPRSRPHASSSCVARSTC